MRVVNGLSDDLYITRGPCSRQGCAADHFGETPALDIIHRKKLLALVLADFVDGDDVGMLQRGGRLGLGMESFDLSFRGPRTREQELQRDPQPNPR